MQAVVLLVGALKAFFCFPCFSIEQIVHAVGLIRRSFACLDKNNNHRVLLQRHSSTFGSRLYLALKLPRLGGKRD
jgi:hypothetical protein